MKKVKEWLKTKKQALHKQFEILDIYYPPSKDKYNPEIYRVKRIADDNNFSIGDIVSNLKESNPERFYKIFAFHDDCVHVSLILRGKEHKKENCFPPVPISQIDQPSLEEFEAMLDIKKIPPK